MDDRVLAAQKVYLENLKQDCEHYNEEGEHFSIFLFSYVIKYIDSEYFTITVFNTLTDLEKIHTLKFMRNSEKFIELAFKSTENRYMLPNIILSFISKLNKTIVRQYVNSEDFTTDIFKVLDVDVKIYIILLFNSTRATEYLLKKTEDITNLRRLYNDYKQSTDPNAECPTDEIYIYYPFLILRALKSHKRLIKYIEESNTNKTRLSILQTGDKIFYTIHLLKNMLKLHQTQKISVSGLNPFLSLVKQINTKGKKTENQITILPEELFNNIGESLYKDYNGLVKTPSVFEKIKDLIKKIEDYKKRNNLFVKEIDKKIIDAYKKENIFHLTNDYNEIYVLRTFEEYKVINEIYSNDNIKMLSNSKSSKSNHHLENLLLKAKFSKPTLTPISL